jgi:pantoate--beta-alanine ligase
MKVIHSITEMQQQTDQWHSEKKRISFVPTMGYLHEGHLSLIRIAKEKGDRTVVSIFVNPTQFGPKEDFEKYPRDTEGDLEKLEKESVDIAFLPTAEEMYPNGFQTTVHLSKITQGLCSITRPAHFDGVATVVLKLFNIVKPQMAVFGEKDYQQLALIRQMTFDLDLNIEIVGGETVRNSKGLALSSRNAYLTAEEETEALSLSLAIARVQTLYREGEKNTARLLSEADKLIRIHTSASIDYLAIVDENSLEPLEKVDRSARFLLAVKIGKTRLIDNGPVQL